MPWHYHRRAGTGVICVTGVPDYVAPFATFVKNSIETMLEYELQMEGKRKKRNRLEQFMYYLLFEENIDMSLAHSLADQMELNKTVPRVAIIIKCQKKYDSRVVMKTLLTSEHNSYLDITTLTRNDNVVLFKAMPDMKTENLVEYREYIMEFIESFLDNLPTNECRQDFAIYVGTIQTAIEHYRASYNQAQEISIHIKNPSGVHFFNDHILDYFRSLVNMNVYDDIFNIYNDMFSEDDKDMVAETVEVLSRNNYNVVSSAKDLFIHRNTLVFRLNKIKNTLNIDPIANASEREFLNELSYYFRHK